MTVAKSVQVLELPADIVIMVCNEWLTMATVGKLDSAVAAKENRRMLLNLLAFRANIMLGQAENATLSYFQWLIARKVSVSQISISKFFPAISDFIYFGTVDRMLQNLSKVKLTLSCGTQLTYFMMASLSRKCTRLESLILKHCVAVPKPTVQLPGLVFPALKNIKFQQMNVSQALFIDIIAGCGQLTAVTLDNCCFVTEAFMETLSDCNPLIANVTLVDSSEAIPLLSRDYQFTRLTALNVSQCNYFSLSAPDAKQLALSKPSLTSLRMHHCRNVTDDTMSAFAHHCSVNLTEVDLHGCVKVSDRTVEALVGRCRHLKTIRLSKTGITGRSLAAILSHCREVETVDVSTCYRLSGVEEEEEDCGVNLSTIDTATADGHQCPRLHTVDFHHCVNLQDSVVAMVALSAPNLTVLTANYCVHLTDSAMQHIAIHCAQLAVLNVKACRLLTPACLAVLPTKCTALRLLNLLHCCLMINSHSATTTSSSSNTHKKDEEGAGDLHTTKQRAVAIIGPLWRPEYAGMYEF